MKSLLISTIFLSVISVQAAMYEQAFPDLNNDGLRDKVELTKEDSGEVFVKLYIAKAKYEYQLVSTGKFLVPGEEAGIAGDDAHLSISDKNEVIIDQMMGSADKLFNTYTFEFNKDNLYLTKLEVMEVYFGDGTNTEVDYKKGTVTTYRIKNYKHRTAKKTVNPIPEGRLLSLDEVQGDEMDSDIISN